MKFRVDRTLADWILCSTLCVAASGVAFGSQPQAAPPVPVISAELGSCSVQFNVQDGSGKPVAGATMRVRIAYGFMSVRKLDLETSTNSEGKVRFEGLPGNLKRALFFRASKDKLEGTAFYDAAKNCAAQHTIVMVPKKEEPQDDANTGDTQSQEQEK
jgi:hypothetical protein